MPKLSFEYVKEYIESFGCKLLSTEYKNYEGLLKIIDACGHEYETNFARFKTNNQHTCKKCGIEKRCKSIRLSYEYVKKYIEENGNGDELISTEYKGKREKLLFKCHLCDKTFEMTWSCYQSGSRHPECSQKIANAKLRLSDDFVKKCIEDRGCELLSEYVGNENKLKIKFTCGHTDYKTFQAFREREDISVCSKCSHKKLNYLEIKNLMKQRGIFIINDETLQYRKFLDLYDSDGYKYHTPFYHFINGIINNKDVLMKFSLNNPYTMENLKLYLSKGKPNLFLEEGQIWNGNDEKINVFDSDGYKYAVKLTQIHSFIKNGGFPDRFSMGNPYTMDNIKNFLKINNKPFSLVDGQEYIGILSPLKFKCFKCPEDETPFERHLSGVMGKNSGCNICNSMMIGKYNNLEYLYPEVAKEWDYEENFPVTPDQVAPHSMKKFHWICPKCNCSYLSALNKRTCADRQGCPKCAQSKGEKIIAEYLLNNNIYYKPQYMFNDCRHINPLPFDFAIFNDINKEDLFMLIEYDGELHFKPYRKMEDGYKKFMNTQRNDEIKNKYCEDNNIELLRIPYWDKNNINEIIDKVFISKKGGIIN